MNRKSFLSSLVTIGLGSLVTNKAFAKGEESKELFAEPTIPPYLKQGDTVAITCPAGAVDISKVKCCSDALEEWGLHVQLGKTVGKRWLRFGGTDEERLQDLQELVDDPNVKAIIFGKGGYGTMRIIDKVNWNNFKKNPKWLVGYSDLTVIHLHVHSNFNTSTVHGHMSNSFGEDPYDTSSYSLYQALFGNKTEYTFLSSPTNRKGEAKGTLVGGNLTIVHACAASKSDITTKGKILFLEDVSEYKYNIDRMMMSLKRSGKLDDLAGLVVGQFTATKNDADDSFNLMVEDIIREKVDEYNYPVCFNFPAGHISENLALKMGIRYNLSVSNNWVTLKEA